MKRNQHFVPQFYLRQFATDSEAPKRRISLYHLASRRLIHGASIKEQCSRDWFYGKDERLESALGKFESSCARLFAKISEARTPPLTGSTAHQDLLRFIAVQSARTAKAKDEALMSDDKLIALASDGDRDTAAEFFGSEGPSDHLELRLKLATPVAECYRDLRWILVTSGARERFVTSDHPVALYNQYCEEFGLGWGTTGAATKGLLVIFPVAPGLCVILFDSEVYSIRDNARTSVVAAINDDVDQINQFQVIGAANSLYFPQRLDQRTVERAVARGLAYRDLSGPRVAEAENENDSDRSLLHQYRATPNVRLRLSFLIMRKGAGRMEANRRLNLYRPEAYKVLQELESLRRPGSPARSHEDGGELQRYRRTRVL